MKSFIKTFKKPESIFAFVAIYAVTAFGWWTFAHMNTAEALYKVQLKNLELQCYEATFDIQDGINNDFFSDTIQMHNFMQRHYPKLELIFIDPQEKIKPWDQFLIRPTYQAYNSLETKSTRAKRMYGLEGAVMLLLLIWGIVWIYQSLNSILGFNQLQNNFMLSITHELKTPLASAKLYMETLLKRKLDFEQSTQITQSAVTEINRLRDLVDNILLASQLENKHFELQKVETNISKLVENCIKSFAEPRNLQNRIISSIEENIFIETDESAIETVVINLISNAFKYSPSDKTVMITLKQNKKNTVLSISDEGPGISESDSKKIFDKFYRIGDESTRKTKGTGLGLFIVKSLLNLLGAHIQVIPNKPNGCTFEVTLNQ
jgi:signal transduction histidine kinase